MRFSAILIASATLSGVSALPAGGLQNRCFELDVFNPGCWMTKEVQRGIDEAESTLQQTINQVQKDASQANEVIQTTRTELEKRDESEDMSSLLLELYELQEDPDEQKLFSLFEDEKKVKIINRFCSNTNTPDLAYIATEYCPKWPAVRNKMTRVISIARKRQERDLMLMAM